MPLSNHEQRMLDEIERNLRDDDPEFAANASFDGQLHEVGVTGRGSPASRSFSGWVWR